MTEEQNAEEPKIIVDDDWKQQAQAEKQKLAEEAEAQPAGAETPDGAAPGPDGQERQIPPANFTTLVSSLATQAMMALGAFQDPGSEKVMVDLELAKHHIDTIKVLEEKTKGNLDEEEAKLVEQAAYQVQMLFVQVLQHVSGQPGDQQAPGEAPGIVQ
ncbi:MAG: DUF1844 domain-containing protein [Phycisphaerales bacterium]|jgi:hypothetical protein|nr:DUF1844 domain-containing protein [Phycisphaerales bacterium]